MTDEYSNYPMGVNGSADYFDDVAEAQDDATLNEIEWLAVKQAFLQMVGEDVKTRSATNLRGRVDARFKELYEQTGAKSFDVRLLGGKVGTFSVVTSKPTESTSRLEVNVLDDESFQKWAIARGLFRIDENLVREYVNETGEKPDGCEVHEVVVPGDAGGTVKSTRLKVDTAAVMDAIWPELEGVTYRLLTEGGE